MIGCSDIPAVNLWKGSLGACSFLRRDLVNLEDAAPLKAMGGRGVVQRRRQEDVVESIQTLALLAAGEVVGIALLDGQAGINDRVQVRNAEQRRQALEGVIAVLVEVTEDDDVGAAQVVALEDARNASGSINAAADFQATAERTCHSGS